MYDPLSSPLLPPAPFPPYLPYIYHKMESSRCMSMNIHKRTHGLQICFQTFSEPDKDLPEFQTGTS
jgi:hypothetical protein